MGISSRPVTASGNRPPDRLVICAPISSSGILTRPMGRLCRLASPAKKVVNGQAATNPISSRAAVPEFGFKKLVLVDNPLFAGIDALVPVHSHYDEVTGLPEDRFEVIASTDDCAVQAFQVRERPVWGVQFHPELDERSGRKMLERNLETEAAAKERFVDELTDPAQVEAGRRLFENFFRSRRP